MKYQSVFKSGVFEGKTIIVTGGGSGIGRCTAHELAAPGAAVALVGGKTDKLSQVAAEISAAGASASTHVCDNCEEPAGDQAGSANLATHARIDVLVYQA